LTFRFLDNGIEVKITLNMDYSSMPNDFQDTILSELCESFGIPVTEKHYLKILSVSPGSIILLILVPIIFISAVALVHTNQFNAEFNIALIRILAERQTNILPHIISNALTYVGTAIGWLITWLLSLPLWPAFVLAILFGLFLRLTSQAPQPQHPILLNHRPSPRQELPFVVQVSFASPPLFISYCWKNSRKAFELRQYPQYVGQTDPRDIANDIERVLNITTSSCNKCWLDVNYTNGVYPLFRCIQAGIEQANIVIVCVSDQYARSDNCEIELNYAINTLHKPIIPIIVGEGMEWQNTWAGLLTSRHTFIDFRDHSRFRSNMDILIVRLLSMLQNHA